MSLLRWRFRTGSAPGPVTAGPSGATPAAAPVAAPEGVTLQDLVLLRVALSWQEAVAVILELVGSLANRHAFPDPAQVHISGIGEVRTVGTRALPGHTTRAAASMLRELLGGGMAPPELRAIIDQNTGADPRHKTLEEFAAALAYFERPGRRGDVAAVYARAHALYVKALADLELERLRAKAMREQVSNEPGPERRVNWPQQALRAALVVVLCVIIAAGGVTLFTLAFAPPPAQDDAGNVVEPDTALGSFNAAAGEVKKLVSTGLEMASSLASKAMADSVPTSGTATETPRPAPRPRATGSAPASSAAVAPDVASIAATTPPAAPSPVGWTVSVRDVTATMNGGVIEEVPVSRADREALPLFSLNNDDVTPATLLRPQLPSRPIAGANPNASTLDLIIDETGRVERVVLEAVHSQVNEKMLVSAAKAWLFQPALRDGQPVRFRLRVQISE